MIKRTIEISTGRTHLSIRNDQLVIEREGVEVGQVPCEDLGILIIDSKAVTYTHAALVRVIAHGAVVVLCGDDHHPAGMLLPLVAHSLQTERLRRQVEAKRPLRKRLWQQIVQAKVRGQAALLPEESPERLRLEELARNVRSGDPDNIEGQAGRLYWPALFGDPAFRRSRDGPPPNHWLNYGYMAVRAAVARAICAAGLHPSLGLQHHNRYNPFCLADDLLEAYRPAVDRRVRSMWREGQSELDKEGKRRLLEVLTDRVTVAGEAGPLMVAVHKTVASLCRCLEGTDQHLDLPQT